MNKDDGLCIVCGQPALPRCYSEAGRKEYGISKMCEPCFDECTLEDYYGEDEPSYCVACGGTGEAPDNGTNMGECDECCGTGVME